MAQFLSLSLTDRQDDGMCGGRMFMKVATYLCVFRSDKYRMH